MTEKTGSLEALGERSEAHRDDAPLLASLLAAARRKFKRRRPTNLDYGLRLAVALLAMEAKQYAAAAEFFELAIAARPKQAGELLLAWGLGLLVDDRAADAAKVFQRGIDEKLLPTTTRPFISTWPAPWPWATAPTRPWPPPARRPSSRKTPPASPPACPGSCTMPSGTPRPCGPTAI